MKIEQLYTKCLAQGAYFIVSNGEAAVIDPLREVEPYLALLKENDAELKYIFETHFHADFVSGHVTLSQRTGAPIVYGPQATPQFESYIAKDGETFSIGNCTIKVLHTPGHTMESSTYLLLDENGKETAIFTGDTLFLGDVGRPDLAQEAEKDLTTEKLAGILYRSLREKIMPLNDDVMVYPGHGAGSACGKNMSSDTQDTLGNQKKTNYALREDMTEEEFVEEVTDGIAPPPSYFPLNAQINKTGYEDIEKLKETALTALSPEQFHEYMQKEGNVVLDVRSPQAFSLMHIPKSISVGLNGKFAPWVGAVLKDVKTPILLVTEPGDEEQAVTRLARIGFDNVLGYLDGSIKAWFEKGYDLDAVTSISPDTLKKHFDYKTTPAFDVRESSEYNKKHLKGAYHSPLGKLDDYFDDFPKKGTTYVYCAGGYRSIIAASLLKRHGIHNIVNISGGFSQMKNEDLPFLGEED